MQTRYDHKQDHALVLFRCNDDDITDITAPRALGKIPQASHCCAHVHCYRVHVCGLIVHYTQKERETVVKSLIINDNVKSI